MMHKKVNDIFFFNDTATTEIYTLSLHDALPICTANRCNYDHCQVLDSESCSLLKKGQTTQSKNNSQKLKVHQFSQTKMLEMFEYYE